MHTGPLSILHLIDAGEFYGAAAVVLELASQQNIAGAHVTVVCFTRPKAAPTQVEQRLKNAGIAVKQWPISAIPEATQAFKLRDFAAHLRANIVHSHGYKGNILLAAIPKRKRAFKAVTTLHGRTACSFFSKKYLYFCLDGFALKRMDCVFIVSESLRQQLPRKMLGAKVTVVPNGLATEAPPVRENGNPLTTDPITFTVGSLGRLATEKNYDFLIRAFARWNDTHKPSRRVVLRVAGHGSEHSTLQALIDQLGVGNFVTLQGYENNPGSFISSLSVYVNCSTSEGLPISLLEVLRQGRLILASDIPANRELLWAQELAYFFTLGDIESLVTAIDWAYNVGVDESRRIHERQRQYFMNNYSAQKMMERYHAAYLDCSK